MASVFTVIMNGDLQQCLLLSRLESSQHTDNVNLSEFLVFRCEDFLELLHVPNCECNILAVFMRCISEQLSALVLETSARYSKYPLLYSN